MKKIFIMIIASIICAILALFIFNRLPLRKKVLNTYSEVKNGTFEISVSNSGELFAENSIDIKGPDVGQGSSQQNLKIQGSNIRLTDLKIQDMVPEGTVVQQGDYIAQLDKTSYDNTLKDEIENLKTLQINLEIKILDTAVVLNSLRNEIKNQKYAVEESEIMIEQSEFESPAIIRKAKMNLDEAQRTLEQKKKNYELKIAQTLSEIKHEKMLLYKGKMLVNDLQVFLEKFTVTAPSAGMVLYKKDWNGVKRKIGSTVNPFDRVIATLPDLSSMISKTYIDEIELSKLKIGQTVNIKVDASPDKGFTGNVISISNIGEKLSNSDSKMFEVLIGVDGSDPSLRPAMTTGNKIIIETLYDVNYIPIECVQTGPDTIPFVYEKKGTRQIVVLGKSNENSVIVEQGLETGTMIYLIPPIETQKFKLVGENLISVVRERR